MADQRISIDADAGALDGSELVPLVRVGSPVTAGSFATGTAYAILSVGTTDFTAIGAASNTVGVGFVATGAGSGTGTAGATSNVRTTAQGIADLGGGGSLALVSTLTASNSASLAWTGLAAGTSWKMVGRLVVPATNNTGLGLVFGTGGGPTYITTGYEFAFGTYSSSNGANSFGAENQALAPLDSGTTANVAPGVSFEVLITTDNATFVTVNGTSVFRGQSTHWSAEYTGTVVATSAAITAMKLAFGAGNITSGNVSLYRIEP